MKFTIDPEGIALDAEISTNLHRLEVQAQCAVVLTGKTANALFMGYFKKQKKAQKWSDHFVLFWTKKTAEKLAYLDNFLYLCRVVKDLFWRYELTLFIHHLKRTTLWTRQESWGRFSWSYSGVWYLYALLPVSFAFHLIWKKIRRTDPMILSNRHDFACFLPKFVLYNR